MVEIKHDDYVLPGETRTLVVNGKRYHKKTMLRCPTCSKDDNFMYVKINHGFSLTLECPHCEQVMHVLSELVQSQE